MAIKASVKPAMSRPNQMLLFCSNPVAFLAVVRISFPEHETMPHKQPGLDGRHRDANGQISQSTAILA
jgi:hypothetical protein